MNLTFDKLTTPYSVPRRKQTRGEHAISSDPVDACPADHFLSTDFSAI